jgi:hypothetical protein
MRLKILPLTFLGVESAIRTVSAIILACWHMAVIVIEIRKDVKVLEIVKRKAATPRKAIEGIKIFFLL